MCLILFSIGKHAHYKLVVAANRDEFYNRPTEKADFWKESEGVLAGRDLVAGGTWMGVTRQGKISMLTNYRDLGNINPEAPSRGHLVANYLTGNEEPDRYLEGVAENGKAYNGFNLIAGSIDKLYYYGNYDGAVKPISPGTHGLSNHLLDTPWPKLSEGKQKLKQLLQKEDPEVEELFQILYDDAVAPDHLLPDTGVGLKWERLLSPMFIKSEKYGSRCSTVVLVDHDNQLTFAERIYDTNTFDYLTNTYQFNIRK